MTTATAEPLAWRLPSKGKVGMAALIASDVAIFVIFIVAYLFYLGKSVSGPTPQVLEVPIFITVCLLSSSLTIHFAIVALRRSQTRAFTLWWILTVTLGAIFLGGTAREWTHLMRDKGLYIHTNLFGTTYYSLVGLHALHVTVGLLLLGTVAVFALFNAVEERHVEPLDALSLYWHFVDVVWVAVFSVVYLIGR